MDERKSKRTVAVDRDSVHVSSPPRIYRRFYDGCRIPSVRYHVSPFAVYATVSLNGKRREQKRAGHVGSRGTGEKRKLHFSGMAWRDVAEHAPRKSGVAARGMRGLRSRRDYVVVETTTLLVCGTERKNSIVFTRANVYIRVDEYIFLLRKNSFKL